MRRQLVLSIDRSIDRSPQPGQISTSRSRSTDASSATTTATEDATLTVSTQQEQQRRKPGAKSPRNRGIEFRSSNDWVHMEDNAVSVAFSDPSNERCSRVLSRLVSSDQALVSPSAPGRSILKKTRSSTVSPDLSSLAVSSSASVVDDDVFVNVGGQEFRHSSAMLSYASTVLAQHFRSASSGGDGAVFYYTCDIPHKSPEEWSALQAFLQPRSVTAAAITPMNLPILLPWFDQLALTVLLQECDALLSSLEWPNAAATAGPRTDDLADLLLLTRSTGKAHLPKTRRTCLDVIVSYLEQIPRLFLELDLLQSLTSL
jgi:hypothetical protein